MPNPYARVRRPRLVYPFLEKTEELVERSNGAVRADKVHERLIAMGFDGDERTTRRAVAEAKEAWRCGHRRRYRPWVPEPGMWLQFDWARGPLNRRPAHQPLLRLGRLEPLPGNHPLLGPDLGTLVACLDATLRRVGGVLRRPA